GNDIAVHAWAPGYARQRLQAYVPSEPSGEDGPGLAIVLMRGAKLEVQGEGFPLSAPLRVSVIPREGYASSSFPGERFFDLAAPVDGSPLVIEGLPQSFLGDVFVAHPFANPVRASFPLVIGASDPMPITVRSNPASSKRARGRVVVAPSGTGAGVADVVVRFEPADLAPFLQSFAGGPGELRPQPSLAWLSAETVTREQGRFEIDLGFPPPWRATVRRDGFAIAQQVLGADEDAVIRLLPQMESEGRVALVIDPARPAKVVWTRGTEAAAQELAADGSKPLELGKFAPGIYRVARKLQGRELAPVELRVESGREARLALGWGRQ
ncbi:MAG: hypothetical protein JNM84_05640, partial [Planctomycetes bacterium]|nr:hypothetical protein [Planctomycetota bacterium]